MLSGQAKDSQLGPSKRCHSPGFKRPPRLSASAAKGTRRPRSAINVNDLHPGATAPITTIGARPWLATTGRGTDVFALFHSSRAEGNERGANDLAPAANGPLRRRQPSAARGRSPTPSSMACAENQIRPQNDDFQRDRKQERAPAFIRFNTQFPGAATRMANVARPGGRLFGNPVMKPAEI